MINLLPPAVKTEIAFAKRNAIAIRYVWVVVFTLIVVAGLLLRAELFLRSGINKAQADLTDRNLKVDSYRKTEADAKALNARITAIKTLIDSQTRFSLVLQDLAGHTPAGVTIDGIALTGNDKLPVRLNATLSKTSDAASWHDAMLSSPRVSAVDIEAVTNDTSSGKPQIKATMSIGFKAGAAK